MSTRSLFCLKNLVRELGAETTPNSSLFSRPTFSKTLLGRENRKAERDRKCAREDAKDIGTGPNGLSIVSRFAHIISP
jgi:hypothetical protein